MKPVSLPIQQQIYTRERHGLFRSAEGFDTVAKSAGLDSSFIKKILHPFCTYDAPAELTTRGEKDGTLYPEALHLFHTETGETVLGRSVYQPADFTGLRSAFLTHNYVISAERSDELVKSYSNWLTAAFFKEYDVANGSELPELQDLPLNGSDGRTTLSSWRELLSELKMDEQMFKQLVLAVMTSCGEGRKKVYVALDVPPEQIDQQATRLLELLYAVLPYEFRRRLGFITYAKEPQSRKFIHLQFVERGSLRANDRSLEKEFTFDLSSGRSTNVDWSGRHPYIDFAWNHLDRLHILEPFLQFADDMLKGMGIRKTAVASYNELTVLFEIEQGNDPLYEGDKAGTLRALMEYLKPDGALDSRMQLNDLLMSLFDREFDQVRQGTVPDPLVAEYFRDYYQIISKYGVTGNEKGKIVSYFIRIVNNALAHNRKDLSIRIYEIIEESPGLRKDFFDSILSNDGLARMLFEPYIQEKFLSLQKSKNVLNLVQNWSASHPDVLHNECFQESAQIALGKKLRDEPVLLPAVNAVFEAISKLRRESQQQATGRGTANSTILDLLRATTIRVLLSEIDLEKLSKEQLLAADFMKQCDGVELGRNQLDQRLYSNAMVLSAAYKWFTSAQPDEKIFSDLSLQDIDRVQQLGRKWLQSEVNVDYFSKLVLGFYRETEIGFVEYSSLLEFLRKNATDKETIYEFFLWSQGHPFFARPRGLVPAYTTAILAYFNKNDQNAFKNRDYRNRYFSKAGAALEPVFEKARFDLSSPLSQFVAGNRKKLFLTSGIVVLSLAIVLVGLLTMKNLGVFDGGTEAGPIVSNNPNGTSTLETGVIVYAEQVAGSIVDNEPVDGSQDQPLDGQEQDKLPEGDQVDINTDSPVDPHPTNEQETVDSPDNVAGNGAAGDDTSASEVVNSGEMTQLVFLFQDEASSLAFDPGTLFVEIQGQEKQQFSLLNVKPGNVGKSGVTAYPWKVTVPLGRSLDIPVGSLITVQDKVYAITEWIVPNSTDNAGSPDSNLDKNNTDNSATNNSTKENSTNSADNSAANGKTDSSDKE
ncbi:glycosyltransferase [Paenibacillus anaericanus]|uniref:Glycosyltransferase n=1 Tax=Paenibacillus anaericanus TaxID=170367 RepID=A0A433YE59_9BACL|nr:glycosyltransferase [Paenibacillus anaericanus]RUT48164.1 glycosyltransferase [Paenibacillus anaericanus]